MKYEDIKTPEELYDFMKQNIKYGFVSKIDKKVYIRKQINNDKLYNEKIETDYYLQTPKELLINKVGLCYDQIEFARKWFIDNNYFVYTYFSTYHNHSILIYKDKDTYSLFERTFPGHNGIFTYKSIDECLDMYKKMQFEYANSSINQIEIYPYSDIRFQISWSELKTFCESNDKIILKR